MPFKSLNAIIIEVYVISKSWRDANSFVLDNTKMAKKQISEYIEEWMLELNGPDGYELSRSEFVKEANTWYLRVYVDKLTGGEYASMSSDDCETVSRFLSAKLDEEDPIEQNYYLEVSSPGLDRLLVSDRDFERFKGHQIDIKLYKALDGKKELSGTLLGLKDGIITVKTEDKEVSLPKESAGKINLSVIF